MSRRGRVRRPRAGAGGARRGAGRRLCRSRRLVLIVGEPGIGKSRLADELSRTRGHAARRRSRSLLGGRRGTRLLAVGPGAARYVAQSDAGSPARRSSGAGAASWRSSSRSYASSSRSAAAIWTPRGRAFGSSTPLAAFLRNAAAARPLVLVLDDLHAADEPSLLLLRFVAGEIAGSRILVVGTYRDVDPTPARSARVDARGAGAGAGHATHRARWIDRRGHPDYVELTAGTTPSAGLSAAIHTETGGNALFVAEVVRLLAADGHVSDVDVRELWTLGIPQGVREVIGRRLRRLSEECLVVLTLASVLGREFALDALQRLSEVPADELLDLLDEACRSSCADVGARRAWTPAVRACAVRDTLYEGLTTPRRVQLHRRAGEALEALYAQDQEPHLAELAHHFFEAAPGGDLDKALGTRNAPAIARSNFSRTKRLRASTSWRCKRSSCSSRSTCLRGARCWSRAGTRSQGPGARPRPSRRSSPLPISQGCLCSPSTSPVPRSATGAGSRGCAPEATPGSSRCSKKRSKLWARPSRC